MDNRRTEKKLEGRSRRALMLGALTLGLVVGMLLGARPAAASSSEDLAKLLGVDPGAPTPPPPASTTHSVRMPAARPAPVAPPAPPSPVAPRELHARVAPAVVGLVVSGPDGGAAPAMVPGVAVTASGLVVTSRSALGTAAEGAAPLALVRIAGRGFRPSPKDFAGAVPARVVALADDLDLALVEALPEQGVFYHHLPIARRPPAPGTPVLVAGHGPESGLWSASVATIGAPAAGATGAARWLRPLDGAEAAVAPGSPIVDAVGRVVGLAVQAPGAVPAGPVPAGSVMADADALWRFVLAAGAPERRFAGVSPLRRPPAPGAVHAAASRAARADVPARDTATALPTIAGKGALDTTLVSTAAAAAPPAPAPPKVDVISFEGAAPALRVSLADLERHAPPVTVRVSADGAPERGPRAAPVTVVELGDYHAPDTRDTEKTLRDLTDGERAPARLVWKDADPGDGPGYRLPARAARAAGEQGQFWLMHDHLMLSPRAPRADELRRFVRALGLDDEAFAIAAGEANHATESAIEGALKDDGQRAAAIPVLATPSFIVNGRLVDGGSVAAAAVRDAVDDELRAAPASRVAAAAAGVGPVVAKGLPIAGARYDGSRIAKAAAVALARSARAGSRRGRR
jgi:protein-disulfide isomerase